MRFLLICLVGLFSLAYACDIIVHVKSDTAKKFSAQVSAPNGKKSEKWQFTQQRQKQTFQQRADQCSLGEWTLETFNESGSSVKIVKVTLNGIGRVEYTVNDNLELTQVERQGAICNGQCAPLGKVAEKSPSSSRASSPTN